MTSAHAAPDCSPTRATTFRAHSDAASSATALEEIAREVPAAEIALLVLFVDPTRDLDELGTALQTHYPDTPVLACTTAGEITPQGMASGTVTAAGLSKHEFQVALRTLGGLRTASSEQVRTLGGELFAELGTTAEDAAEAGDTFAFLLIDGLSVREEFTVAVLGRALGGVPLLGGSAGDGMAFEHTKLWHDGTFQDDVLSVAMVRTTLPFEVFKTEHFVASDQRLVVTGASPDERVVSEINGMPAAAEYARTVGVPLEDLSPMRFAEHPLAVRVGGVPYVRSIQRVTDDGSLVFFCAIDTGAVLTVAKQVDMLANLESRLTEVRGRLGEPEILLCCDCILRRLETERRGTESEMGELLAANRAIGFHTYGEQLGTMHVNQTFTAVAIGRRRSND